MGDIKKTKKKFERPKKPWEKDRIIYERELINTYGYKNKKEIWRFSAMLRGFRAQARNIVASRTEQAKKEGKALLARLHRMALLEKDATFDDVLELTIDDISKRRLTPMVVKKGLARTPKQARQFIVHKHIVVAGRKINSPNYIVLRDEENSIEFAQNSPFRNKNHPLIEAMNQISKKEEEKDVKQ